jgi:hypothetical protein
VQALNVSVESFHVSALRLLECGIGLIGQSGAFFVAGCLYPIRSPEADNEKRL